MPKYIGRKINIWFWKESTRGTAVAISNWIPKTNIDFDEKFENAVDESSIWIIVDSVEAHTVKRWSEWKIEANLNVNSIWLPLLSLLWAVVTTPATTGAYLHTFNLLNSNSHPSLTIWMSDDVEQLKFALWMIEEMTITANAWEIVTISMTYKAKKWETTTHTVTYWTDYTLLAKSWLFKIADNLAWLDLATNKCVQSFEITIKKNLEEIFCIWSIDPTDFVNKQFTIEWSFTATYENATDYKTVGLEGSEKALRFALTDTTKIIWLSDNPGIVIDLPKVNYTEWSRSMWNDEVVSQTINFKWLYSKPDAKAIEVKLTNDTASY